MSRRRSPVPAYRLHSQSGQAVVTVYHPDGSRRDVLLGRYDSPESKAEYARVCAALRPGNVLPEADPELTVSEMIAAFWRHATVYYRLPDGTPTTEVKELQLTLKPFRAAHGGMPAAAVGPKLLKGYRQSLIDAGLCRTLINQRVGKIRRVFKWAASEELIPEATYGALVTVAGLPKGRSEAPDRPDVLPVPAADLDATLPFLPRLPRAIVELMRHTGMRPGEACRLSLAEVDRTGDVWVYRPARHKTAHRGKTLAVPLGPRSQAVLAALLADYAARGLLPADPAAPLFCAARERERRFAAMRAGRKSKVQPSQASRRKGKPKRAPKPGYGPLALAGAVRVAAAKAGVPHWHPNMIRHLVATEVRKSHGLDAAQALLGHSCASMTEHYAELDVVKAVRVATDVG